MAGDETRARAAELRRALVQEREALLQRILEVLRRDERVTATWLFGSLGRTGRETQNPAKSARAADELSDLDLWVVVADEYLQAVCEQRRAFAAQPGEPLLVVEAPQNAPAGGAYLMAVYPGGETGPFIVDWYWQPAGAAAVSPDPRLAEARLLFERAAPGERGSTAPLPGPASHPAHEPRVTEAEHRAEEARNRTSLFWAMLLVSAKYAVRQRDDEALFLHDMLRRLLRETREFAGPGPGVVEDTPPPTRASDKLDLLRRLAAEMETLMPRVAARGGEVPWPIIEPSRRYLGIAQALVDAKSAQVSG